MKKRGIASNKGRYERDFISVTFGFSVFVFCWFYCGENFWFSLATTPGTVRVVGVQCFILISREKLFVWLVSMLYFEKMDRLPL